MLDDFRGVRDREVLALCLHGAVKRLLDDARARNAHVDHDVGFADAEISASHEGYVLRNIAEDNELCAADRVAVLRRMRHVENAFAHEAHGIHVDAGLRRPHIDRGADAVRGCERLGERIDQVLFARGHALFNEGAEAADEVDAHFLRGLVEHAAGGNHFVAGERGAHGPDGRDGNALIDDGYPVAVAHEIAGFNELRGIARNLGADLVGKAVEVGRNTVEEVDTHRDGAHVEVLRAEHVDGGKYLAVCQHFLVS